MELILWRHADAEDGTPDAARELTDKGRKQARNVANWLKKRVQQPVRIIASPTARAQQTARAFSDEFETDDNVDVGATRATILKAVGWPHADETVVVVGHQPSLGRVAAWLLTGKEADWEIKKGSLWWFSVRVNRSEPEVTLRAVMRPNQV